MKDEIRYNLVTVFCCADCNRALNVGYQKEKEEYNPETYDSINSFAGAAKVDQRIKVYPCQYCYKETIGQMDNMQQALKNINKWQKNKEKRNNE